MAEEGVTKGKGKVAPPPPPPPVEGGKGKGKEAVPAVDYVAMFRDALSTGLPADTALRLVGRRGANMEVRTMLLAEHVQPLCGDSATALRLKASPAEAHGSLGDNEWSLPFLVAESDREARPGYNSMLAHEYIDEEAVLRAKVQRLASFIIGAKHAVLYTGAGISTSAGVPDYATRAGRGAKAAPSNAPLVAQPTFAHRALVAMHSAGYFGDGWVQQNHDGLPQKAGFPQSAINEIHGAWFDPSNRVVQMNGGLREDLYQDIQAKKKRGDLVLALGTSLAGMSTDALVQEIGTRTSGGAGGAVIVSLQQTALDGAASLRIFAPIDDVLDLLARELGISVPAEVVAAPAIPAESRAGPDVFLVPYSADGHREASLDVRRILDLSTGAPIVICGGSEDGSRGKVVDKTKDGHYQLAVEAPVGGRPGMRVTDVRYLGSWWVSAAVAGDIERLPVSTPDVAP